MTIEQKAAAYDRALEVLHKYDGAHIMFTADLKEEMFPELIKESTDERMIKILIKFIEGYKITKIAEFTDKEIIAWLEKQGEQKPAETHVDWSEEDERNLNDAILFIETGTYSLDKDNLINFLKSLKDRVQPQPKREWSEEDEMIALSIEQVMNCASLLNIVPEKIDKIRTWLKSLKPQNRWRPSNEQMEAMNTLMVNLIRNPLLLDNFTQANLRLLYDDLKKLK